MGNLDVDKAMQTLVEHGFIDKDGHPINIRSDAISHHKEIVQDLSPVTLKQRTGWISVSERLPEEDVKVLTTIKWKDGSRYVDIDSIVDGKWMLNIPEDGDTTIAWMPLPKPYEPQESEVQA